MKAAPLSAAVVVLAASAAVVALRSGPTRADDKAPATQPSENKRTTASGLTIIDQKEGDGPAAKAGDTVTVHYTGRLQSNGEKFDSSRDRNEPFTFPLGAGQVIKGWDEGVAGMKVGGKRQLIIPADLGYGDAGAGDKIPPGATLVFDVELLKVGE